MNMEKTMSTDDKKVEAFKKQQVDDAINRLLYGTANAQDMAPEVSDVPNSNCLCGHFNCPDEYAHTTSGY